MTQHIGTLYTYTYLQNNTIKQAEIILWWKTIGGWLFWYLVYESTVHLVYIEFIVEYFFFVSLVFMLYYNVCTLQSHNLLFVVRVRVIYYPPHWVQRKKIRTFSWYIREYILYTKENKNIFICNLKKNTRQPLLQYSVVLFVVAFVVFFEMHL